MNIAMLSNTSGKQYYKKYRSIDQIIAELDTNDMQAIHEYQTSVSESDIHEYKQAYKLNKKAE